MKFDHWLPGVLSARQICELRDDGRLLNIVVDAETLSSIDLHLTGDGYELLEGSVKPSGQPSYLKDLENGSLIRPLVADGGLYVLQKKRTYLFKLRERLNLRDRTLPIYGQATAKSSVGRVDVLARLIVDGMADYEMFDPDGAAHGTGDLYVEITPITFDVCVKSGIALTQLRFFLDAPKEVEMASEVLYRTALKKTSKDDGTLSVDLTPVEIGGLNLSAFATSVAQSTDPIRLWTDQNPKHEPWRYWRFRQSDPRGRLRIEKDEFYILRSKEHIALPSGVAVYCRASDETIGEMRIHYAGFVHPYFGRNRSDDGIGTPLIFEVRGHDVNVNLLHGERMARLIFYRMSEDAIKGKPTPYDDQSLRLSNFFEDWPKELTWENEQNGVVKPKERL